MRLPIFAWSESTRKIRPVLGPGLKGLVIVRSGVQNLGIMDPQRPSLTLLEQREIEARIVGPLIRAVQAELGTERALALVRNVIGELARQSGSELARRFGEATLEAFASSLDRWCEAGALEIEILEQSAQRLAFNVIRCRYAEMYRALGLADLGSSLSCQRDFALVQGFNPNIQLTRTQTIMEGASHCDFRFEAPACGPEPPEDPAQPAQDPESRA